MYRRVAIAHAFLDIGFICDAIDVLINKVLLGQLSLNWVLSFGFFWFDLTIPFVATPQQVELFGLMG